MDLRLERTGGAPVYLQIASQIRERIESGALADGDRLPPIRSLAEQLAVNRDTVSLAYEALAAEGIVDATVGRGTFVRSASRAGRLAEPVLAPAVDRLLEHERRRPLYAAAPDAVRLHAVAPDPEAFPVEAFRACVDRALAQGGASLLDYGPPEGHPGLREVLADHLGRHGVRADAGSLVVTHGASQGIALALRVFASAGDAVAVEEPTYHNVLGTLEGLGLRAAPVPMRGDGPDREALDRTLARPDVKLLYTIPTFHNPMGIATSLAHRRDLLAIALRHGTPVVEDAFEMDLRFAGRPVPSLAALDESGLVMQLTSFSKSLFPGVRVGAVLARGRALQALLVLKQASDLGGALPLQAGLAEFVASGAYERHLRSLRRRLRVRRDAALAALAEAMPPGTGWTRPDGGYQLWVELPEPLDSRELFVEARRAGVLVAPGFQFYQDGRPSRALRLSISQADEADIRRGIGRLGALAGERLAAGTPVARAGGVPV